MLTQRTKRLWAGIWRAAVAASFLTMSVPAIAQINISQGKPVIDGSGSWDGGVVGVGASFDAGTFPARLAVDGNTAEPTDGAVGYWLGREQTLSEYFTVDLLDTFEVNRIDLFNTHNRQFNDRGTDEFVVFGATAVDAANQLVAPFPIVSGNLADVSGQDNITPNSFTLDSPVNTRYVKFEALTSTYGNNNVGLNEIQVFTSAFESPNKALGRPVIDGSGSWDGGVVGEGAAFDGGTFPATNVTDGSVDDTGFWLGREGVPNEYFVLDLEEVVNVNEILLRNTHNGTSDDRGSRGFRILAADSVDGGNQLVNPVEILSGSLPNSTGISPLLETVFTADNGLVPSDARYLRFESLSATYFNDNVGLNEIEVYAEVMHDPTPPSRDNIALGKPIIDGSGSWDGQPFDGGTFPANRVTDGSAADAADGRSSFWLASEFCPGEACAAGADAEAYFTLDLGDLYTIEEIDLRNTHNRQFNDRGTEEFVIFGAEAVDENGQLIDPTVVLAGTLPRTDGQAPISAEIFTDANGLVVSDVRYLKFQALTSYSTVDTAVNGGAGLNEIEIYGTLVPEPSSVMISLAGVVGWLMLAGRRRRNRV